MPESKRVPTKRLRMQYLRKNVLNKSQHSMAVDLDVSGNLIRHIESGRSDPSIRLAFRIAEYLGSTVDDVFSDLKPTDMSE